MFTIDRSAPPIREWLSLAYALYKEFNFRILDFDLTIILSKRK